MRSFRSFIANLGLGIASEALFGGFIAPNSSTSMSTITLSLISLLASEI